MATDASSWQRDNHELAGQTIPIRSIRSSRVACPDCRSHENPGSLRCRAEAWEARSVRERGGLQHAGKVGAGVAVPAAELDKLGELGKDGAAFGGADHPGPVPLAQFE